MHRGWEAAAFVVGGVAPAHPAVPRSAFRPRRTAPQDGASIPSRDVSSAAISRVRAQVVAASRHRRGGSSSRGSGIGAIARKTGARGIDAPDALRRREATRLGVNPRDTM